jgi:hypothetical protein
VAKEMQASDKTKASIERSCVPVKDKTKASIGKSGGPVKACLCLINSVGVLLVQLSGMQCGAVAPVVLHCTALHCTMAELQLLIGPEPQID